MEQNDTKVLVAEAELGEQAKKFLVTKVGRYIDGCSKQDIDEAKDQLFELDPYKFDTLVELQNAIASIKAKAVSAMKLRGYISEAIVRGNQAVDLLSNEEPD